MVSVRLVGLLVALTLSAQVLKPSAAAAPTAERPPNIIFILCDDLGWGDLGVLYQNTSLHDRKHKTPQIDRLALEGVQLRAHYCPAPVCAPSRASLLTGVHQGHAAVRDNQFDKMLENNHTLASVMRSAGYRTAIIGKYGLQGAGENPGQWEGYPTHRGFDEFFGYVEHRSGHQHYPGNSWPLGNSPAHKSPQKLWHNDREISSQLANCYTTDLFTARSKHWIGEQVADHPEQPFFLYLAYDTPHAALQVPTCAYPAGSGLAGGVQWLGKPGEMINTAKGEIDSYRHPDYVGHGWTDVEERFATMVRRIDDSVGDLLQTLKDMQIDEQTLVVFSSDNGPHHESYLQGAEYAPTSFQSYGPFEGTKRDTWEGGVRMPTLVRWPQHIPAGGVDEQPSQFQDWMPTFAELAGGVAPARTDGVSLLPSLLQAGKRAESTIYVEYQNGGRTERYQDFSPAKRGAFRKQMQVLHLDGFKGVRTNIQAHRDPFQIYDLSSDPKELKNLAGSSRQFDELNRRMQDRVLQLRVANDSAPRPYDKELIPAVNIEGLQPGLAWSAFEGDLSYVPQVASLNAAERGTAPGCSATSAGAQVLHFHGYLKAPVDGDYQLAVRTSTRGFVRLHTAAILDADYDYPSGTVRSRSLQLQAGLHPIQITCLADNSGKGEVELLWTTPGENDLHALPNQVLSHVQ